jgi:Phosphotransferase enzyme family
MSGDDSWQDPHLWHKFSLIHPEFERLNLESIQHVATTTRGGTPCRITRFTHGVYNTVFEATFNDNVIWICRVHGLNADVSPACVKAKIESTVATMRYIRSRDPSIPIPAIYDFESDPTISTIGFGYILMEAMNGVEVDDSELTDEEETQVYSQLAGIVCRLSRICLPKIGRIYQSSTNHSEFYVGPFVDSHGNPYGPFNTSVEFFNYEAGKISECHREWRAKSIDDAKKSEAACLLYKQAASSLSDYENGSFPIAHGDFDTHNALFKRDVSGNLVLSAVLDWDSAHTVTWLEFCFFPAFLAIRWPALEAGKYSQRVLESIKRQQQIFLHSLQQLQSEMSDSESNVNPGCPPHLHDIFDTPPVRVAEFILKYSDPRYQCDERLIRKYLVAWRQDWEIDSGEGV